MLHMLTVVAFVVTSVSAGDPAAGRTAPDRPPSTMTNSEIKAHNEGLPPTHPYYVKCRKIEEIGSLVKKARVCHTNEQWKQLWAQGNQDARDTVDHFGSKGSGCPPGALC
jgi:hypothetical protein